MADTTPRTRASRTLPKIRARAEEVVAGSMTGDRGRCTYTPKRRVLLAKLRGQCRRHGFVPHPRSYSSITVSAA